jgi:hypothetical protein
MQKAEVLDYINDPEILVAGGRFDDLLRCGQLNQRCVFHFGANVHDIFRVVLHGSGCRIGQSRCDCAHYE